jgi:hypothetical protein
MNPYTIEAEYESGYVHRETDEDRSPYVRDANIFSDIVNRRPDVVHGPLLRFTLFLPDDEQLDVDFTKLPADARPFREKDFELDTNFHTGEFIEKRLMAVRFGVEYEENGETVSVIRELR